MRDIARTMEKQLAVLVRLNKAGEILMNRHEKMMNENRKAAVDQENMRRRKAENDRQAAVDQENMRKRKAENALMKGVQANKLMMSEAAKKLKGAATDGQKRAAEVRAKHVAKLTHSIILKKYSHSASLHHALTEQESRRRKGKYHLSLACLRINMFLSNCLFLFHAKK